MTYAQVQAYFAAWAAADPAAPAFYWGPSKRMLDAGRDAQGVFLWISEATWGVNRFQDGTQLEQTWTLQVELRGPCAPDAVDEQDARMQETYTILARLLRYLNQQAAQGNIDIQDRAWLFREAEQYEPENNWGWVGSVTLASPFTPC